MATTRSTFALALTLAFAAGFVASVQPVQAQDAAPAPEAPANGPALYSDGPYVMALGRFMKTDGANALDYGFGGTVGAGMRRGPVAFEVEGLYTAAKHSASLKGGSVNGMVFPFEHLPGLYGLVGVGLQNVDSYPGLGDTTFNVLTVDGGAGYLFPLKIGRYEFGVRAEALYEYGDRQKRAQDQRPPTIDQPVEPRFHDIVAQIGLQFPFDGVSPQAAAPEPPVHVVPPVVPVDSDGDGVPDSLDQCADTPAGTKVDEKGCPLPPPCKAPAVGEQVSLAGCGTGDTIVLRGVNFDSNKSTLTPNARIILDGVAQELTTYPDLKIELDGYTDSKASDAYNQKLSERRAAAVVKYLTEKGVAADRLSSVGHGESQPVADNSTDEGRELNRRVELKILSGVAKPAG